MNPFVKSFAQILESRYAPVHRGETLLDWVSKNTMLRGKPYSTEGYPFQEAIMNDLHPNMVVKKCSQVGITEVQMRKATAWLMMNRATRMIYGIPTTKLYKQFSQTRLRPMLDENPVFNKDLDTTRPVRSMDIIQLNDSFMYVKMVTEGDATSTPADFVIIDELDLADQQYVALYMSRLQNSDYKITQKFSTPTLKAFGIDAAFTASDQHYFLLKCPHCGRYVWPEYNLDWCYFPDLPRRISKLTQLTTSDVADMDLSQAELRCKHCGGVLDYSAGGEWVAKHPLRTTSRGYMISPFSTSRIGLGLITQSLCNYKALNYIRGFHNTVLGEAYEDATTRIPISCIEAAFSRGSPQAGPIPTDQPLAIGIDVGSVLHLVLGNLSGDVIYLMEQVPRHRAVARIKDLCKHYKIVAGGIDRYPEVTLANKIRDVSNDVIQPIQYAAPTAPTISYKKDPIKDMEYIQLNRTKSLDGVRQAFLDGFLSLNGYSHMKSLITVHMRDNVRDEQPECPAIWKKTEGNDHFFHATGYYLTAPAIRELVNELQPAQDLHTMADLNTPSIAAVKRVGLTGFSANPSRHSRHPRHIVRNHW